jgi:hypothetical protein
MNTSIFATEQTAPRVPPEVKALFSQFQLSEPNAAPLKGLSDEKWTSLLAFCDISRLTLPIAQFPMEGFPSWVVERLRTNLADNALHFERVKDTYREAADALERAGVEHIVLKGITQSPDYVADPRLRAQNDLDIFCPPERIEAAQSALQTIGYRSPDRNDGPYSDHCPPLLRTGEWRWRGNPFDPEWPLGIELHFCFWNERVSRIRIPGTDAFWERRVRREVDGISFSCMNPVDHLAFLTLHILRNLFLGEWIVHHVRELAAFLHSHSDDDIFWQCWDQTHSLSLGPFAAIAFYLARAWFGCRLHPLTALDIDRIPVVRKSWLQCFSGSVLGIMFEKNQDAMWLQLTYLSSRSERWTILKRNLIPNYIGSINSPYVQARNKRLLPSNGRPLWQQYIAYLFSRSAGYVRADSATLWRGLCWRLNGRTAV